MTETQAKLIGVVTKLVLEKGIPTALEIIKTWEVSQDPTVDEILALSSLNTDWGPDFTPKV